MIGVGRAFGQMVQGDMAAQQFNQNKEQSKQQAEKFKMLKTQFDQSQTALKRTQAYEAVYNAKNFGEWSDFPTDEGESVRAVNDSDFLEFSPDGTKSIGGQVRNKFMSETGTPLPEDNDEALDVLGSSGVVIDERSGISSFVTADQLGKGIGSGYGSYERKRQMQDASMMKKLKGSGELSESGYADILGKVDRGGFDSLSDADKVQYSIGTQKFKMGSPQARKQLYSQDAADIGTTIKTGENLDTISDDTMNFYLNAEDVNGSTPKNRTDVQEEVGSIEAISSIQRDWASLKPGEVASGLTENAVVDVAKLASTDKFKEASMVEQKNMLKTVALRSKTGMFGAKFLNAISGAAVSEEEYQRIMNVLTGGQITQNGVDVITAALGGAAEGLKDSAQGKINAWGKDATGSKIELAKALQSAYNLKPQELTSTGSKTAEDVAAAGLRDQASQATAILKGALTPDNSGEPGIVSRTGDFVKGILGMNKPKPEPLSQGQTTEGIQTYKTVESIPLNETFGPRTLATLKSSDQQSVQRWYNNNKHLLSSEQIQFLKANMSKGN